MPKEIMTDAVVSILPEKKEDLVEKVYSLEYKNRSYTGYKHFLFTGSLREAIVKAQNYCASMRYKFVHCEPFLSDLDEELKRFSAL